MMFDHCCYDPAIANYARGTKLLLFPPTRNRTTASIGAIPNPSPDRHQAQPSWEASANPTESFLKDRYRIHENGVVTFLSLILPLHACGDRRHQPVFCCGAEQDSAGSYARSFGRSQTDLQPWRDRVAGVDLFQTGRLILVTHVGAKSPAEGVMQIDDVPLREETLPIHDICISLHGYTIQRATQQPEARPLSMTVNDKTTIITVPRLEVHSVIVLDLSNSE